MWQKIVQLEKMYKKFGVRENFSTGTNIKNFM